MRIVPLLIVAFASAASAPALVPGDLMPPLRGEFLSGRKAVLPDAARGRVALVALGFSYDSRFAVDAWITRFRQDFGADSSLTFFEVPVLGGLARAARPFIDGGMRRGTPKALHENVITVYGGASEWKSRLGFREPDDAYLLLLDRAGRVAWRHAGPLREQDYDLLAAEARRQVGP
jgi:hypothetical protein